MIIDFLLVTVLFIIFEEVNPFSHLSSFAGLDGEEFFSLIGLENDWIGDNTI